MILARFIIENPEATALDFSSKPKIISEPKELFGFVVRMPKVGEIRTYPGIKGKMMVTHAKGGHFFRLEITLKHEVINQ